MRKVLTLMTVLFILSAPNAYSQICNGDFDCDNDVDGTDAVAFKNDFFRKDCPDCTPCKNCQAWINENIDEICEGYVSPQHQCLKRGR
jgi:NADH:ubiquinone oxidoreductase subunit F (NADH-binding)